jgi:hypothetical protein
MLTRSWFCERRPASRFVDVASWHISVSRAARCLVALEAKIDIGTYPRKTGFAAAIVERRTFESGRFVDSHQSVSTIID